MVLCYVILTAKAIPVLTTRLVKTHAKLSTVEEVWEITLLFRLVVGVRVPVEDLSLKVAVLQAGLEAVERALMELHTPYVLSI